VGSSGCTPWKAKSKTLTFNETREERDKGQGSLQKSACFCPEGPKKSAMNVFPIVGIGSSAGGLEALEQFFAHVPVNSGMGFIVIQHLDPTRKALMPELIQRNTKLKVMQARDRVKVAADHVISSPQQRHVNPARCAPPVDPHIAAWPAAAH